MGAADGGRPRHRAWSKMILNPSGTDILYNHGFRTISQYIAERGHMIDLGPRDAAIDDFIARIVDLYLIQDPESNEEFAFNNGINDAIDIIRSYKLSWR